LVFNGSETSGFTTIEFARLLSTGDDNDNPIPSKGSIPIIWAYGNDDSFSASHTGRGAATLITGSTTTTEATTSPTTTTTSSITTSNQTSGLELVIATIAFGVMGISIKKRNKK
jgi:hypothetical protein